MADLIDLNDNERFVGFIERSWVQADGHLYKIGRPKSAKLNESLEKTSYTIQTDIALAVKKLENWIIVITFILVFVSEKIKFIFIYLECVYQSTAVDIKDISKCLERSGFILSIHQVQIRNSLYLTENSRKCTYS